MGNVDYDLRYYMLTIYKSGKRLVVEYRRDDKYELLLNSVFNLEYGGDGAIITNNSNKYIWCTGTSEQIKELNCKIKQNKNELQSK